MRKPKFNYQKITKDALSHIPERPRKIIDRRHGISTGREETLQEIGGSLNITRERVRQIEDWGFRLLENSSAFKNLKPIFQSLENYINELGGLKKEDVLFYDLAPENQHSSLSLVLWLAPNLERFPETPRLHSFWSAGKKPQVLAKRVIDFLIKRFKKQNSPIKEKDLQDIYQKEVFSILGDKISRDAFLTYIEISKEIKRGAFDKIGLSFWPEISPRGVRDEAYLTFKKEEKPIHFSDLTDLINEYFYSEENAAQVQTVHNELIKDPRFVLVGRGIYALKEWGYEPGVVKDVIAKILKENKKPLTKEQIVDEVLKLRMVKKNTILFNLQNKNHFQKLGDGKYQIA